MDKLVQAFFRTYEAATATSDFAAFGELYADTFMFAGPNAFRAVRKEDFLKVIPRMKAQYASLGLTDTRLLSVEAVDLDSRYVQAKVHWRMTICTQTGPLRNFDAFATYVLQRCDDKLCIVFQLDHQDLPAVIGDKRNTQA